MRRLYVLLSGALLLSSCNIFEIHPYSGDITGKRNINVSNIARIEAATQGKDTLRYAFVSDSQRWYDEMEDCVQDINARGDIDFVIHGGDLTDFGLTKEFLWQRDILEEFKMPYVVVIGNHDCLANGEDLFAQIFGPLNFSFIAGKTKFLCLNTNALEADYSRPIPDFEFIRSEREKGDYNRTVVSMHAKPTSEQFNNNVKDIFHREISAYAGFQYVNYGHQHQYYAQNLFGDGKMYYGVPNVGKRQYFVFTLSPSGYEYELVSF